MIRLTDVAKSFDEGATWAVRSLDLHIPAGSFVSLVGGSGSGKTTTLKLMNRLVEPTRGRIEVDGQDVSTADAPSLRRRMGYVLQSISLFPHMSVADNIAVVPRLLKWPEVRVKDRVSALLTMVDLDPQEHASRLPSSLSGGQAQRVGVARALAAEPHILLMDEPFGALDPVTRQALQADVLRLHRELNLTTVLVTHDMAEALLLSDIVVVMRHGELVQMGTPGELLRSPADDYVVNMLQAPLRHAAALAALQGQT